MNKLVKTLIAFAVLLAVFGIASWATSVPAYAQGNNPGRDVRVINTSAESVPVNIQNLPAQPSRPEPVMASANIGVQGDQTFGSAVIYTVPEGKMLVIEYVSYRTNGGDAGNDHSVSVVARFGGSNRVLYLLPQGMAVGGFGPQRFFAGEVIAYADSGTAVSVQVFREDPIGAPNQVSFTNTTMTGYLVDAP